MVKVEFLILTLLIFPFCDAKAIDVSDFRLQPQEKIHEGLLPNLGEFLGNPFFEEFVPLHRADRTLKLNANVTKDYFFPTLYGDVTMSVGIFYCNYDRASRLMPSKRLKPVRASAFNDALVIISSYHYGRVYGISPYNEIAISIPVSVDYKTDLLGVGKDDRTVFVALMPVTTLENRIRGRELWGLPKELHTIHLYRENGKYVTRAMGETGEPYLELHVPLQGEEQEVNDPTYLLTMLGGRLKKSTSHLSATFKVNQYGITRRLQDSALEILGDSPWAQMLHDLQIDPQAVETRFATGVSSTFDLPGPTFR